MYRGNRGDLKLLRGKAESFPENPLLKQFLGMGLSHYSDQKGAVAAFLEAARLSKEMKTAARAVESALELEPKAFGIASTRALRALLLDLSQNNHEDRRFFVDAMLSICEAAGLEEVARAVAEFAISVAPEDTSARFELARRYSENKQDGLSMLHYQSIPREEREGMAWNNLGVDYARLDLPGKAVEAYQAAAKMGETIAEGNLAQKLASAGFFDDAQRRVESAISVENHHESLVGVLASINKARAKEADAHLAAETKAREHQAVRSAIGEAAVAAIGPALVGLWDTALGPIQFRSHENDHYVGVGEFTREHQQNALTSFIVTSQPRTKKNRIIVRLTRFGNAFEGTLKREIEGARPASALLGSMESETQLLLRISEDGTKMEGLEIGYDERPVCWHRQKLAIESDG